MTPAGKSNKSKSARSTAKANGASSDAQAQSVEAVQPAMGSLAGKRGRKTTRGETTLSFEARLFESANALRNSMEASEYKHVVLGLLFLKYVSDAFDDRHAVLEADRVSGADPEDPDEYRAEGVFWVPKEARWAALKASARQPSIGQLVDDAMVAIERDNPSLQGSLQKDYARATLDKTRLGQLIDLVSDLDLRGNGGRASDLLGRVYEYFLARFAAAEGKGGGEFYTPRSIVRLLVEMIEPFKGRVYDPCCGSGGMFVQSEQFLEAHGGRRRDLSIFGQESNPTTWRMARMNLAIRGIEANIIHGDSFMRDGHPDLRADYVLANPPFNISDWQGASLREDKRWQFGLPPESNANFAWLQHIVHHLAPTGVAGVVLTNGSMSSFQSGEGEIRAALVEADVVDCMVALPGQLFYSTQIAACLWFLSRNRKNGGFRDRRGEVLFIDARNLGRMIDRTQRELTNEDVARIAATYHSWRGEKGAGVYADVAGYCKSATLDMIRERGHILAPGRYVGAEARADEGEQFSESLGRLVAELGEQRELSVKLDAVIAASLEGLGNGQ